MCELFGVSFSRKRVVNPLLDEFFSHGADHPHGWGLAFFGNGTHVEKEAVNSCESTYLRNRLRTTIAADTMLAHIRLATRGVMDYTNTHPFVLTDCSGRTWTQVHNGTIFAGDVLSRYADYQSGDTDSERLLMHLVARMNERIEKRCGPLGAEERFEVVDGIIREVTPDNKVNVLLYDGEVLYVHSNLVGSLYQCWMQDGVAFSTRPLGNSAKWSTVPLRQLIAYRNGAAVAAGTKHDNEFFQDKDAEQSQILRYLEMYSRPQTAAGSI